MGSVCIRALGLIAVVCLASACSNESAGDDATSEAFATGAGTVVGGKDGIRSFASSMNHDAVALSDGSAVTPIDQRYDTPGSGSGGYVFHALEFVSAAGDAPVKVTAPDSFWSVKAGPDGSALVLGGTPEKRTLHRIAPSSEPVRLAERDAGGATTATDGSIVWIETGASPKLHRIRDGRDTAVPIAKDPYERTFAECRTFLFADADHVYDVCISSFTLRSSDRVERVRTFAADGSLEAEITLPHETFGGILTGFDGGGRLLLLDTGYTGDGDKNVGVHGYRYDPKTKTATVLSIPVFPRTERWRPYSIIATPDGGFALPGKANDRFGMVKLLADGTLDQSFDADGAMSAEGPDDWHILLSGRLSADAKRIDLLGFGADGNDARTYRLAVQLR
jgi:hypothetical protein